MREALEFARVAPRVVCDERVDAPSRLALTAGTGARGARRRARVRGCPRVPLAPTLGGAPSSQRLSTSRERFHGRWLRAVRYTRRGAVTHRAVTHRARDANPCSPRSPPRFAERRPPCRSRRRRPRGCAHVRRRARRAARLRRVHRVPGIVHGRAPRDQRVEPAREPLQGYAGRGGKLAAQLIGAHGGDDEDVACVEVDHERLHAGLRAKANALLAQFVECAPTRAEALERRPSAARHAEQRRIDESRRSRRRRRGPGPSVDPQAKGEGSRLPRGGASARLAQKVRSSR